MTDKPMSAEEVANEIESVIDYTFGFSRTKATPILEQWAAAIRADAVAGERERCAKLIEERQKQREANPKTNWPELDATAIRNRAAFSAQEKAENKHCAHQWQSCCTVDICKLCGKVDA